MVHITARVYLTCFMRPHAIKDYTLHNQSWETVLLCLLGQPISSLPRQITLPGTKVPFLALKVVGLRLFLDFLGEMNLLKRFPSLVNVRFIQLVIVTTTADLN